MEKLSDLFWNCHTISYDTIGDDVNYKFIEDDSTLYIYFQGSNSVTDWIRNFLFFKKPYKDMEIPYYVHCGFLKAWKEVEDLVIEKIQEQDARLSLNRKKMKYEEKKSYKFKKIIIVGYSHGGALAAFCHECCWYWRNDIRDNIFGFGFEAPRIYRGYRVKKELKERWKNFKIIRDNNDLVTHCPPKFLAFTHVNNDIIKIKGDTSLVKGWWIPKCIKSHLPDVVLDGLKKYEEEATK